MRIPVSHETVWHYINLFGLSTLPMAAPVRNNFLYVHNTRLRTSGSIEQQLYPKYNLTMQEKNTPWNTLNKYANTYRLLQLSPEVRSETIQILPEYSPGYLSMTEISLRQNYETLGLSQEAIHMISGIDPASGALLSVSYGEIAQDEYSLDFLNIYRIQGGNVNLPLAFYNSFASGNPPGYTNLPLPSIGNVLYKAFVSKTI
jgi:monoamine oxidase